MSEEQEETVCNAQCNLSPTPGRVKWVVSACLAGIPCRYDGCSKPVEAIRNLVESGLAVAVCPEQLGGLPTPRPASGLTWNTVNMSEKICQNVKKMSDNLTENVAESQKTPWDTDSAHLTEAVKESGAGDDIGDAVWRGKAHLLNREGVDVTANYKLGAERACDIARRFGAKRAILKQHSPSCGCGSTGGANPWKRLAGNGVTTAYFLRHGIEVISDEQYVRELNAP